MKIAYKVNDMGINWVFRILSDESYHLRLGSDEMSHGGTERTEDY